MLAGLLRLCWHPDDSTIENYTQVAVWNLLHWFTRYVRKSYFVFFSCFVCAPRPYAALVCVGTARCPPSVWTGRLTLVHTGQWEGWIRKVWGCWMRKDLGEQNKRCGGRRSPGVPKWSLKRRHLIEFIPRACVYLHKRRASVWPCAFKCAQADGAPPPELSW